MDSSKEFSSRTTFGSRVGMANINVNICAPSSRCCFQTFFIFDLTRGNDPFWLNWLKPPPSLLAPVWFVGFRVKSISTQPQLSDVKPPWHHPKTLREWNTVVWCFGWLFPLTFRCCLDGSHWPCISSWMIIFDHKDSSVTRCDSMVLFWIQGIWFMFGAILPVNGPTLIKHVGLWEHHHDQQQRQQQ